MGVQMKKAENTLFCTQLVRYSEGTTCFFPNLIFAPILQFFRGNHQFKEHMESSEAVSEFAMEKTIKVHGRKWAVKLGSAHVSKF